MRWAATLLALAAAGRAENPPRSASMDVPASLAAAETAFAAQSLREGMRAAFLANFAADGVFVRNGWANCNAFLAARPDPPIVLDWRPAYAEVAASGEMGLSTGPWKLTSKAKPDAPPAYGQFVSIWKREPGKPWRVAVDLGIAHPEPLLWSERLQTAVVASSRHPARGLTEAEALFARDAAASGGPPAVRPHGPPRKRLYP